MQYRVNRLAQELKQEISFIIAREVKDPRVGFATITDVRVSPDLRHARIYFSILGSAEQQNATLAALQRAAGFIRRQIGSRIKLRHTPELIFSIDEAFEYGLKMDGLIAQVSQELSNVPSESDENDPESAKEGSVI